MPAEMTFWPEEVVLDSVSRRAVVLIHPFARKKVMVGKEDQIVRMLSELTGLVSEITGWKISLARTEKG